MSNISKRFKEIVKKTEPGKLYSVEEALKLLKDCASVKFVESVDICVNLGVDLSKSDQGIRGSTVLPHGTGCDVRVAVFAQGDQAVKAKSAGADVIGFEDLAETIKKGEINFDVLIATPDAMKLVGQLGQVLGPKGLMPNPKVGTVAADVVTAVKNAKSGQARFRTDKAGIIHCSIGRINFEVRALQANLKALIAEVRRLKPSSSKGIYLKKVSISTTMGPGLLVDPATI